MAGVSMAHCTPTDCTTISSEGKLMTPTIAVRSRKPKTILTQGISDSRLTNVARTKNGESFVLDPEVCSNSLKLRKRKLPSHSCSDTVMVDAFGDHTLSRDSSHKDLKLAIGDPPHIGNSGAHQSSMDLSVSSKKSKSEATLKNSLLTVLHATSSPSLSALLNLLFNDAVTDHVSDQEASKEVNVTTQFTALLLERPSHSDSFAAFFTKNNIIDVTAAHILSADSIDNSGRVVTGAEQLPLNQ